MAKKKKKAFWFWPSIFSAIVIVGFGLAFLSEFTNNISQPKKVLSTSVEAVSIPQDEKSIPKPTQEAKVEISPEEVRSGFCLNVPILLYHHVQPAGEAKENGQSSLSVDSAIFDQQMAYLASRGYTSLSADQLANALLSHSDLPGKSILITFDDGYQDNYNFAFPVLRKHGLKANLMVVTGLVGNPGYLNWGEIREMKDSGVFSLGNHTWSHYTLTGGLQDKINSEIKTAEQQLVDYANVKTKIFAYPYGAFNNQVIKTLQENGFVAAFSTIPGFWQCDSFIMSLHRNRVGNSPLSSYGL